MSELLLWARHRLIVSMGIHWSRLLLQMLTADLFRMHRHYGPMPGAPSSICIVSLALALWIVTAHTD